MKKSTAPEPAPLSSLGRRDFLKKSALASLALGSGMLTSRSLRASDIAPSSGPARNIIFMVSDGMSMGTFTMANQYRQWRDGQRSHWVQLYEQGLGRRALMDTASLNNLVTDSSAASSAWGCGQRINNGAVNVDPAGKPLTPILLLARAAGKGTGLVTTAAVTHATPAGFSANQDSRDDQTGIADQYLEREYDIILGGGLQFFDGAKRKDQRDLLAAFAQKGYAVTQSSAALREVPADQGKLLGVFASNHLPYELDRINDETLKATVPSLADMTRQALSRLNRQKNGFILQVEAARVDHAAHNNDIGGLLFDQLAFDDTIAVVAEFQKQNPDTLVFITTDHGNANPGLNNGPDGGKQTFSLLSQFKGTQEQLALNKEMDQPAIRERLRAVTGLDISEPHADMLYRHMREEYQVPYKRMNTVKGITGQIIADHVDIGWVGNSHTSDHVELFAMGPGSERVTPFIRNCDVFGVMVEATGIPRSI